MLPLQLAYELSKASTLQFAHAENFFKSGNQANFPQVNYTWKTRTMKIVVTSYTEQPFI